MRALLFAALSLLLLVPAARAQTEAAAPLEDRAEIKHSDVERGLFVGAEAGGVFLFAPQGGGAGFSPGRSIALSFGGDIGERFSLALLVLGTSIDTPPGYTSKTGKRGDFSGLTLGATARFSFWARPDANDINRTFLYAKVGGGAALLGPSGFFEGPDVVGLAGVGCELYTNLRHFSVGMDADFLYGIRHLGPGFMLQPHVRYTF